VAIFDSANPLLETTILFKKMKGMFNTQAIKHAIVGFQTKSKNNMKKGMDMPVTMKAAVWEGRLNINVKEVAAPPSPQPGWVNIKVEWCGICGSDLHEYLAGPVFIPTGEPHPRTGIQDQCILGHEFSGSIVSVGEGVENISLGDRVTASACQHCGECLYCKEGHPNLCETVAFTGLMNHGGFANFVTVPANVVYKIPENVSFESASLVEPLSVGMHAVKKAGDLKGKTVAVLGAGTIGLCTIMCARALGAEKIIAVEVSKERKNKALELGANIIVDPKEGDAIEQVKKHTGGYGASVTFECIGHKDTAKLAIDLTRKAGKVIMVGIFEEPSSYNFFEVVATEKEIIGSLAYQNEFEDVIKMISDGLLETNSLVTGKISIDDIINMGFEELVNNKDSNIKILVSPN